MNAIALAVDVYGFFGLATILLAHLRFGWPETRTTFFLAVVFWPLTAFLAFKNWENYDD